MWIRITCPNGHALEQHELRRAARTGTCPTCHAIVSMWIKVACKNGHMLKVRTKYAGREGKCPQCSLPVPIPELTEEQLFSLLDAGVKKSEALPVHQEAKHAAGTAADGDSAMTMGSTVLRKAPKTCPKCKQKCSAKYTICPNCRTILPMADFAEAVGMNAGMRASMHCPDCGATSFPGSPVCTNCGMPLVENE